VEFLDHKVVLVVIFLRNLVLHSIIIEPFYTYIANRTKGIQFLYILAYTCYHMYVCSVCVCVCVCVIACVYKRVHMCAQ
jgi:hypothetical protein